MAIRTASQKRTRTAALAQVAKELNMEFSEKDEWGMKALPPRF